MLGKTERQTAAMDTAQVIEDMNVPGYRLHPLKGRAKDRRSIWVSGNRRLTIQDLLHLCSLRQVIASVTSYTVMGLPTIAASASEPRRAYRERTTGPGHFVVVLAIATRLLIRRKEACILRGA
jgi:hypothetical protein